jgi:hypothetical protein
MKLKHHFLLGEDHYKLIQSDYEAIRARRKKFKGKPDAYDQILIDMDKMFEAHYKKFLD